MAQSHIQNPSHWKVPEVLELDERREALGISSAEFSRALGSSENYWGNATKNNSVSKERLRRAHRLLNYIEEEDEIPDDHALYDVERYAYDTDGYKMPTLSDVKRAIEERGIGLTHLSYSVLYADGSLDNAFRVSAMAPERLELLIAALQYYDEKGIIPLPEETLQRVGYPVTA